MKTATYTGETTRVMPREALITQLTLAAAAATAALPATSTIPDPVSASADVLGLSASGERCLRTAATPVLQAAAHLPWAEQVRMVLHVALGRSAQECLLELAA